MEGSALWRLPLQDTAAPSFTLKHEMRKNRLEKLSIGAFHFLSTAFQPEETLTPT
jgi:hypothetical protein